MARVSIEQVALTDLRYQTLGRIYRRDRFWGLGVMVYVWNQCQELGRHSLAPGELQDIHPQLKGFAEALVESSLGRRNEDGTIYIAGTRGRIEWLNQLREQGRDNGQKGGEYGQRGGRPRSPQPGDSGKPPKEGYLETPKSGLGKTPPGGYVGNPPPTPTPTLTLLSPTDTSVSETTPQQQGAKRARSGVVKTSPFLEKPPAKEEVQAYLDSIQARFTADEFLEGMERAQWTWGKTNKAVVNWKLECKTWQRVRQNSKPPLEPPMF